ncbi:MAG: IclR family transcriptional regulator [Streptomycetales bacterium]
MAGTTERAAGSDLLQTLDRGLRVLGLLRGSAHGLTVGEVAQRLVIHRSIASRLLATLAWHHMVTRSDDGRYRLGTAILEYARAVLPHLRDIALPELRRLTDALGVTAHLSVAEGGECVAVAVVEPQQSDVHVAYRVGSRHPLAVAAGGLAILAGRPPLPGEPEEVAEARRRGFATSRSRLQPGAVGISAPITAPGVSASVGVIFFAENAAEHAEHAVLDAARAIGAALGRDDRQPGRQGRP